MGRETAHNFPPSRKVLFVPLYIDDGYTLKGQTTGKGDGGEPMPVVSFEYRPPLSQEMGAYRHKLQTAPSADAVFEARVNFLLARLVSWDVCGRDRKPLPIKPEVFALVPDPIFLDMVNEAAKWRPRSQEEAAGN